MRDGDLQQELCGIQATGTSWSVSGPAGAVRLCPVYTNRALTYSLRTGFETALLESRFRWKTGKVWLLYTTGL